jgi:hypothetical protein
LFVVGVRGKLFPAQPVLFIGCTAHLGQRGKEGGTS